MFKSNAEGREGRQILVDMPRMMPDYGQNMQPGFSVAARALEHGWRVGSGHRAGTKCRQARSGAPASVAQSVAQ